MDAELPNRQSIRKRGWNYAEPRHYFVKINTQTKGKEGSSVPSRRRGYGTAQDVPAGVQARRCEA